MPVDSNLPTHGSMASSWAARSSNPRHLPIAGEPYDPTASAHLPGNGRQPKLRHAAIGVGLQLRRLLLRRESSQQRVYPLLSGQSGVQPRPAGGVASRRHSNIICAAGAQETKSALRRRWRRQRRRGQVEQAEPHDPASAAQYSRPWQLCKMLRRCSPCSRRLATAGEQHAASAARITIALLMPCLGLHGDMHALAAAPAFGRSGARANSGAGAPQPDLTM